MAHPHCYNLTGKHTANNVSDEKLRQMDASREQQPPLGDGFDFLIRQKRDEVSSGKVRKRRHWGSCDWPFMLSRVPGEMLRTVRNRNFSAGHVDGGQITA